jgi:hypothetical protein
MITWQFWTLIGVLALTWLTILGYLGVLEGLLRRIEFSLDRLREEEQTHFGSLPEEIAMALDSLPREIAQEIESLEDASDDLGD